MKEQMIAVGYVRRSTDRQEMSLEQQRAKLEQFASARGWKIAKIFCDDAVSGSEMKRPGLESLMSYARASTNVGAVITWERNRISRPKDPVDGLMLERELLAAGKRVLYAATGQEADRSFASGLMSYVENFQNGDTCGSCRGMSHAGLSTVSSAAYGRAVRFRSGLIGSSWHPTPRRSASCGTCPIGRNWLWTR